MPSGFKIADAYVEVVTKDSTKAGLSNIDSSMKSSMTKSGGDAGDSAGKASGSRFSNAMHSPIAAIGGVMAGAFAVDKVVSFFGSAISEARESQKVNGQTEAVIKSTGGAAKVSAGQMGDYATAISNKTGIDDEQIQAGENMLATFTNVRNEAGKGNDIFKQATSISTDLAVATGVDQVKANVMLGKALNDPIAGMGALKKVGVTFNDAQKTQITTMMKAGDTMGAQKVILAELSKEFGGSAAAQSTAGEKASNSWNNLKEAVGTGFLPVLDTVMGFISNTLIPGLMKMGGFLADNGRTIGIVAGIISAVFLPLLIKMGVEATISAAKQVAAWVTSSAGAASSAAASVASMVVQGAKWVWMGITALAGAAQIAAAWLISLGPIAIVIAVVVGLGILIFKNMDLIKGWISAAWDWIKNTTETIWNGIKGFFTATWNAIKTIFTTVFNVIKAMVTTYFNVYKTIITTVFNAIKAVISAVWAAITLVFTTVFNVIKAMVTTYFNVYKTIITTVFNAIKAVITAVINGIQLAISTTLNAIKATWSSVWNGVKAVASSVWNGIKAVISGAIGGIQSAIGGLASIPGKVSGWFNSAKNGISSALGGAVSFVRGIPGKIIGALGNVGSMLYNAGRSIIQGLIDGISNMVGAVKNAVGNVLSAARDLLPFSPAKEGPFSGKGWTTYSGAAIVQGLSEGIMDNASSVGDATAHVAGIASRGLSGLGGSTRALSGGGSLPGASGAFSGGGGPTYTGPINVTIPVKDLKEFKTVKDFFDSIQQQARKGAGVQVARA